ncbi:MAG: glycosyltransferase [Lachnospiraceae bacterium]|nr:glycosyltransferase [Lachnospiraceae bacterium]
MTAVSICIIGKNEESHVERLFKSIEKSFKDYPHEVLFVDTGSEDDTVKIAEKYADKVLNFEWIHDFSAARNFAMENASNDAVFFLDCDEEITYINIEDFGKAVSDCIEGVGMVRVRNCYVLLGAEDAYTEKRARICNRNNHRFEGKIGERIIRKKESLPVDYYDVDVTITHYGFLSIEEGSLMRVERNLPLLLKAVEEQDVVKDTALYFMLGQHYALLGETEEASRYMKKGMDETEDDDESNKLLMALGFGYTLLHMNNHSDAIELVALSDQYKDSGDFSCLMGIVYQRNGMIDKAMDAFEAARMSAEVIVEGANTFIPCYNMACIHELYGETDEAMELYELCEGYGPAEERLAELEADV